MDDIYPVLIICGIIIFLSRTLFFLAGSIIERRKKLPECGSELPFVSIIVPARNEEPTIEKCIDSIAANDYPPDKYEIIAVNDRSSDKTGEILDSLKRKYKNLRICKIQNDSDKKNLRGKPGALQAGIETAKGEIFLFTDADCTVAAKWIQTITRAFLNEDVGLVPSFTNIQSGKIFSSVQAVEWIYLHTMAAGGIGFGQPLGCYGNNLSVRAADFHHTGGYRKIKFSVTEDLALMQAIHISGKKIRYLLNPDSTVKTLPCINFKEYLKQHHRWVIGAADLGWRAAIFVISSLALWIALIAAILSGNITVSCFLILFRISCDCSIILPSIYSLKQSRLTAFVIPAVLFFMFMELLAPLMLLKRKVEWKGRQFATK